MATPARPHRRLVWKYVAVVGTLVAAAIVSVGISEFWFSYEDSKRAVTEAEADKASSAAISIRQFIEELGGDLEGVAQPIPGDTAGTDRQRSFRNLFLRQRAISALTYLDATGAECVHTYSNEVDKIDSLTCEGDRSDSEEFRRARAEQRYFGAVAFEQHDGRPHMDHRGGRGAAGRAASSSRTSTWGPSSTRSVGRRSAPRATPTPSMPAAGSSPTPRTSASSSPTPTSGRCRRCTPHWPATRAAQGVVTDGRDPAGDGGAERVRERRPARLAGVRRGAAERGVRAHPGGDLADGGAPRRVPPGGDRDERAARPEPRQAHRGDPGRGGEDRLRVARSADRGLQPRRARRPGRRVQPDGRPAARRPMPGSSSRSRSGPASWPARWRSWTRRPASSRPPAATSRNSWPTCRTSCGPR